MDARKIGAWIPITDELLREAEEQREAYDEMWRDVVDGPRYGPGRAELWDIQRSARILANLAPGHPAGRYRRH